MINTYVVDYKPAPGQLCTTFKGKDSVYPVVQGQQTLISDPLTAGEVLIITKSVYHEELSSYYIEFLRGSRLFYTYFYEQVFHFDQEGDEILRLEEPKVTFDYPWVICEE